VGGCRYSELQRDMQRKLEELSSKDAHADDLQRRLSAQEEQLDALAARLAEETAALAASREQASSELVEQEASSALALEREQQRGQRDRDVSAALVAEAQQRVEAAEEECEALRREVAGLEARVEQGLGSKKTLEDYKLRAQKAVKQVRALPSSFPPPSLLLLYPLDPPFLAPSLPSCVLNHCCAGVFLSHSKYFPCTIYLQANTASAALSAKLSEAEAGLEGMDAQLSAAEADREALSTSLRDLQQTLEAEREQNGEDRAALEAKSFELQSEVLTLQASLAAALEEAGTLRDKQQQLTFLLDERGGLEEQKQKQKQRRQEQGGEGGEGSRGSSSSRDAPRGGVKSSTNKTAVVVPVRQPARSSSSHSSSSSSAGNHGHGQQRNDSNTNSSSATRSVEYISNDSDCVLVKDDVMDYIEVDANAQSDVENSGNVSENSSVVVQWKNILHRPGIHGGNSPTSDSATDTSSPLYNHTDADGSLSSKQGASGIASNNTVRKVESLASITSGSSDYSLACREREQEHGQGQGQGQGQSDLDQPGEERSTGQQDFFFVNELKRELHRLRQELSSSHLAAEDLRRCSTAAEDARARAVQDYNELKAFHERTKKLLSSPDSAMNIEYLKTCVYRLMVTKEVSERSRLYPVISVLLKFTPAETREVSATIAEEVAASSSSMLSMGGVVSPAAWLSASSTLGGMFGGGGVVHGGMVTSTGEVIAEEEGGGAVVAAADSTSASSTSTSSSWW
jgi:hypothetical protein